MELAIPLFALAGIYASTKQQKEGFSNSGATLYPQQIESGGEPRTIQQKLYPSALKPVEPIELAGINPLRPKHISVVADTADYVDQTSYRERAAAGMNQSSTIPSSSGPYIQTGNQTFGTGVPLFDGAKPRGQLYSYDTDNVLDKYSGHGSQTMHKQAQAPMFKPQQDIQYPHGMPIATDYMQSRVVTSNKFNSINPFGETVRVGPGLNQGYTAAGSVGFNSGLESRDAWMPKTVDEMRIASNPKETYTLDGLQGAAVSHVKKQMVAGETNKNLPEMYYANTPDRWFTTTGQIKGETQNPTQVVKPTFRAEHSRQVIGNAAYLNTAGPAPQRIAPSNRDQLNTQNQLGSLGGLVGHGNQSDYLLGHRSVHNVNNSRSSNAQPSWFGSGFNRAIGAVLAPFTDMVRPVCREEYGNMGVAQLGSGASVQGNSGYLVGNLGMGTTVKESTLYTPNGWIQGQTSKLASWVNADPLLSTHREQSTEVVGGAANGQRGIRLEEADYNRYYSGVKEGVMSAPNRVNMGGTQVFEGGVHQAPMQLPSDQSKADGWMPAAAMPIAGPSASNMGHVRYPTAPTDHKQAETRLDPDMLTAFKNNPYTQTYGQAF